MSKKDSIQTIWKDKKHWGWFPFSFTTYSLSEDRLFIKKGFFSTHYDETLLYRIIDICLQRTLLQKIFGTGTIILDTKSDTQGKIILQNIKNPIEVNRILSDLIEQVRQTKGVVGREFYTNKHNASDYPENAGFSLEDDHES